MNSINQLNLIKQGAEAKIYQGLYLGKPTIAKERFTKTYRHNTLDSNLTKERIKAECRALLKCKKFGIRTPAVYLVDFKRRIIFMEYMMCSKTVKAFIEEYSVLNLETELSRCFFEIGKLLGKLHENHIVHGDLTSSNMLLINKNKQDTFNNINDLHIVLIDFGLACTDANTEDKGVDLYVLERALLSTHSIAEKLFPKILDGYAKQYKKGYKEVFVKYEDVRARGRKRTMVG